MRRRYLLIIAVLIPVLSSCHLNLNADDEDNGGGNGPETTTYTIVTSTNLPSTLTVNTQKVKTADLDDDGDLDLVLAIDSGANKILINNGSGSFTDESSSRLPAEPQYDTRDVAVEDFNGDNNPDLFFVSNQDQASELYLNDGKGDFSDLSNRIPVTGISSSVTSGDFDGDGDFDIIIGNSGQNIMLINNGNAFFTNQTADRLPQVSDETRDIAFGDITGDNRWDLIVANEDANRVLINTGAGYFVDQTGNRIPFINQIEETRDINLANVDGDEDLDIYFGNSGFQSGSNAQDRLLINNSTGVFSDQTTDRLPVLKTDTFDADFADLDQDGDLDITVGNYDGGLRILLNNGAGFFEDQSSVWLPQNFTPDVTDLEIADYNGDGLWDIYVAVHDGTDQLLLHN